MTNSPLDLDNIDPGELRRRRYPPPELVDSELPRPLRPVTPPILLVGMAIFFAIWMVGILVFTLSHWQRSLDGETKGLHSWTGLILVAGWAGLLALFRLVFVQTKRLLQFGQAAPAVVTGITRGSRGRDSMHYTFFDSHGVRVEGRDSLGGHPRSIVGEVITILYDPDKPSRNTRYPTGFEIARPRRF